MTEQDMERLMQDSGIIRNRKKIEATITNTRHFWEIQKVVDYRRNVRRYHSQLLVAKYQIQKHNKILYFFKRAVNRNCQAQ